jgi:hypothetical protein
LKNVIIFAKIFVNIFFWSILHSLKAFPPKAFPLKAFPYLVLLDVLDKDVHCAGHRVRLPLDFLHREKKEL